jgi:hypothetical protein
VLLAFILVNILLRLRLVELFSHFPIQAKDPGSDESGYLFIAMHFWDWLLHGNAIRLPVYPAFISILINLGSSESAIYIIQHLLYLSSALLLSIVLFKKWGWRLILFNLLIFYGPFMVNPNGTMTETFTASILMISLAIFIRGNKTFWIQLVGAASFSLLALTRPNFLFLFPAILIFLVLFKQSTARQVAAMLLVFIFPVSLWVYRNYSIQGSFVYCTVGGEQLFRESRIVPPCFSDEIKFFETAFGSDRPENMKMLYFDIWKKNIYHDNRYNYLPVDSGYPLKNDIIIDRQYKNMAKENYTFYIKNRIDLLFNKLSLWIRNFPTTCTATFEYLSYRNGSTYIDSKLIGLLYVLATIYDLFFFPTGLLMLFALGIMILIYRKKITDFRLFIVLYSILFYSLIFPIPTQIGGRITMIYMLAVIFSSIYFIFRFAVPLYEEIKGRFDKLPEI